MSYLVMECRPAYVVVLDEQGRFVRVPNLGYEVGQRLDDVVTFDAAVLSFEQTRPRRARRGLAAALAAAACLCALVIGGFATWQTPIGTVHMSINPEVDIDVNPANGDLYVCSQATITGYTLPGYVYRYDASGRLVSRYDAGVHPCAVIFN